MLLDAVTAKALAALVLTSTQGVEQLTPQLPLQVVDRGEDWLVKGTPYTDSVDQTNYNAFWIFIRKTSAEVVGIGFDARAIPTDEVIAKLKRVLTAEEIARVFGPRTRWEPGGPEFSKNMSMNLALYHGLINKPVDAVAYAHVLMETKPEFANVPERALKAEERDKVWHVTLAGHSGEVLSFSRISGKLLSGNL